MTTFDQPDSALLVEHLLPSLLGANHSLSQDVKERMLFFGEIGTALEQLHGRLTVISSPPTGMREPASYPWLWRYVNHFTVGRHARAVQHAKLWAFHWKVGDEEQLDLYVSSTNLTASAFKAQVQAGWNASVCLGARATIDTRRTWGELIPFLEALGSSAGAEAEKRLTRLVTLLGRVECPAKVTFVASVPGNKSAARQLKQFEPSEIHVMTPTIGEWNSRTLGAWAADVGVAVGKLHLKWIATNHPWEESSGWRLTETAGEALKDRGVQVECFPTAARFMEQHRDADKRWSHAKLYLLRSGRKRRLLVTSANWSVAAWGAGKCKPRNFELGVVFESEWTDLESIGKPFDPPDTIPFYQPSTEEVEKSTAKLEWVEASWDGRLVQLRARSLDEATPITAIISFSDGSESTMSFVGDTAALQWVDAAYTPLIASFTQAGAMLEVDVLDLRSPTEFSKTPLPEIDPVLADALREAFLLQRYGGMVIDADSISELGELGRVVGGSAPPTNYSVQAWLDARAAFGVVDSWRAALDEAEVEPAMRELVRLDGEALRAIYSRRVGPAAALVAEELMWRLAEEP